MVTGPSPRKNWRLNKGARDYTVIAMKGLGIVLLSIASIAVLLVLILPVIFSQVLARYALRVDTHRFLVRPAILGSVVSKPLLSLMAALLLLIAFGWGISKLSR